MTLKLLLLGWLAAVSAFLLTSYKAGCAGGTKGGALGDVHLALKLEGAAFAFEIIALIFFAIFLARSLKMSWFIRGPIAAVLILGALVCMFYLGVEMEHAGVRECF